MTTVVAQVGPLVFSYINQTDPLWSFRSHDKLVKAKKSVCQDYTDDPVSPAAYYSSFAHLSSLPIKGTAWFLTHCSLGNAH